MNASVAYRWRNAEMLVLAPLYGKETDVVLSRAARKPVASSVVARPNSAGIPIPSRRAAVDARRANGSGWRGTAEVLLTQTGSSLSGNVTLHHPAAGIFQIPITSGTVQDGKVVFFGHSGLPLGTVDLSFRGIIKNGHIDGGANVELQCLFGQEHDQAKLQMAKV